MTDIDELVGQPAQAIVESGSGALMLVVGSRGVGAFAAMVLGSVSRYAVSHASCPVVVVRDEPPSPYRHVAVGLGDLDNCADALTFAFEDAALRKARLTVILAWYAPQADVSRAGDPFTAPGGNLAELEASQQLEALLSNWRAKYPDVRVHQDVVHGHPARADLVVIGRHARHPGWPGPGAVRHAVLNHAHGPVATVPLGLTARSDAGPGISRCWRPVPENVL
ncbi:MAG: universal stress protein [Streptosporangiaceae bacterium]